MRRTLPLIIALSLAVLSLGCEPDIVHRKNVICMIDYSGTIKTETLNIYAKTIADNVFGNLAVSDKWMLIPVDEGSKIKPVHLLEDDLSKAGLTKNISSVTHRSEAIKEKLDEYKRPKRDSVFNTVVQQKDARKEYTNYTDILGALEQVSPNLEHSSTPSSFMQFWDSVTGASETQSENAIVIFSDMIHESSDLNFQHMNLDEKTIDKIIADLKAKNKIPDLTGTKIFVCGRTGKNNKMIDGIQNFWKKYFAEAHADLKVYDYDSSNAIANYMQT